MVTDIGKAFRKNWVKWEEPSWKYYDEPELALAALDALMSWQEQHNRYELVIDIECGIEKDVVFDHPNQYQMLCVGLAYAKGKAIVIGEKAFADDAVKVLLGRLLERSKLIGHNLKFDLQGLWKYYKNLTTFFDTMIAHYVIDERPGQHSLDMLGQEILGAPNWKYVIQRYIPKGGNYADVPREILYKYCAFDCAVTWDLYEVLRQDLDDLGTPDPWPYPDVAPRTARELHDWLVAKADQLMFLELNGVTVDLEYSRELGGTYQEYLNKLEEDLDAVVNEATNGEVRYINPRSPKQVKEFLEREGCRVEKTDRDTLEALLKRADPESTLGRFLRQMLFHRKEQKKMSTYVTGIRRRVRMGRVFTTYLLHGTTSGRLASRNPNLQNIMRDKQIRNQFTVSKEDNVFVHCLVPGTRVLMKDLTWRNIEDVRPSEEMIAFDENDVGNVIYTKATKTSRVTKKCYKITLEDGTEFTCSEDHKWAVGLYGRSNIQWRRTDQLLKAKVSFKKYVDPWKVDTSYEGGYLAGFLDGEAALTGWDARGTRITFSQNSGEVIDEVLRLFKERGFETAEYGNRKCRMFYLAGDNRPALRAIGMFRPKRFLAKQDQLVLGRRKYQNVALKSIEYVGEKEVIALETDSHTFFAEGYLSHNCDYKQAEGRVIAWLARDEYLRSVFADPDQDLFNTLGARLYGVDPEDLDKEKRVRTKAYFYGLGYGREAYSIAMEYELPVRTVERDLEAFFDMLGNVRPWQESIKQTVHERQELITPFGRRRTFALITEENRKDVEKEALSYLPQSTASDICLDALGELRPALRGKAFLRMTIHDALIAECHKSKAEEVGALMQEVMIRKAADLQTYVPFDVDVSIGKRWGEL
jgi:DNA polymerase I-like protein with 3'-5' exonuclease and polymerase domains